jgi:Transcriptional regulator
MELTQLEQFKTIATSKTMTEAAQTLHISQPALSTRLKKLEEELGVRLFDRINNTILLNEAGTIALNYATEILDTAAKMKSQLHEYAIRNSIIKIAFDDPGPMWHIMPHISTAFGDKLIKNEFYKEKDEIEMLLNEKYDIIICSHDIQHPSIICKHLIQEQLYLSVPMESPLSKFKEIDLHKNYPTSLSLFSVGGEYEKQKHKFWQSLSSKMVITKYTDYFIFSQAIRNKNINTTTTKIVRNYRDDGLNRHLILITNQETMNNYYIAYLKKEVHKINQYVQFILCIMELIDK